VACIIATIVSNLLGYLACESKRGSSVAVEWNAFKGFFKKNKG
jgi:hypothetical protein